MWHTREVFIPTNHACAAGHFPDNPVVPGALLLDSVLASITGVQGEVTLRTVKFLHIVRYGTVLQLRWQNTGGQCSFECHAPGDGLVMSGRLQAVSP